MPKGTTITVALALVMLACGNSKEGPSTPAADNQREEPSSAAPSDPESAGRAAQRAEPADTLPHGLLLAYSHFPVENGRPSVTPGPARLEIVQQRNGEWIVEVIEDPSSNVFHKAMVFDPPEGPPGILTVGGMGAAVKLWRRSGGTWQAETLWQAEFGGERNRMRDVEIGDLFGDGRPALAVATHDQGVVAVVRQAADGTWSAQELDRKPNTFVHEIELGDLNGDGVLEIYATPSEPNTFDEAEQHGEVVRYLPRQNGSRTVVADLGNRHAKEIWVGDVDGDGRDELYVAVEALVTNGRVAEPVEIRRYEHDTPPDRGAVIARIPNERLLRFLTVGDVDGDGKREMVAAGFSQGIWLLRPGRDPRGEWSMDSVDRNSGGFEHAALIADLDENGAGELYVAADEQGEVRRYVWVNGRPRREVLLSGRVPRSLMTFNIMPVPVSLLGR
jgi:hypothetical protein